MPTDYYDVLGVPRTSPEADIKKAYRNLARKYHPDVAEDKAAAENHFKEINEAYEVLSDPQKRANYDRFGHAGDQGSGMGGFAAEGFGDIFDMFFGQQRAGGGAPGRANGPQRGSDLRYDVEITLDEAFAERSARFRSVISQRAPRVRAAAPNPARSSCRAIAAAPPASRAKCVRRRSANSLRKPRAASAKATVKSCRRRVTCAADADASNKTNRSP